MPAEIKDSFHLALAQLNPVMGDLQGNAAKARDAHARAHAAGAHLVAFPELFLSGYPPEDLVVRRAFVAAARAAAETLARATQGEPGILIGLPWAEDERVYNAYALLDEGRIQTVRYKVELPNYGTFDEKRVFAAGPDPGPVNFRGLRLGVPICEDIWIESICETLAETGAELLIVPNGSPYWRGKAEQRIAIAVARVVETRLPLAYLNQVGGQDELVFDGASFVLNGDRSLALQMPDWEEAVAVSAWSRAAEGWRCEPARRVRLQEDGAATYLACMTGLRDYVGKNGFPGVVLGLSGGIDSALCAAMAVDALGPERVHAVMLPYSYTSNESLNDAAGCAEALAIRYDIVPIHAPVDAALETLAPIFNGVAPGITEENLQSRLRGTLLMAISNKQGPMVVTTGNKSEVSVGYATLYGDMNGGFNPIKDLYKTQVYALARWRNAHRPKGALGPDGPVMPENILIKAPTAELRANQRDQDSLPPYDALDDILECLVEREMPVTEIVARGHAPETVKRIENLLYIAEYKRRQAPPGVKITAKNFGRDRRYPITNKFRESV